MTPPQGRKPAASSGSWGIRDFIRRVALALVLVVPIAACAGSPSGPPVRFKVPNGSGLSAIADTLAAHDIVDQPFFFQIYARLKRADRSLKPGTYAIQRGTSWAAILDRIVAGDVLRDTLVVPEGWTAAQIAQAIGRVTDLPADSVESVVMDTASASRYGVPGPTLEGYLYPATYVFPVGTTGLDDILQAMIERYDRAWAAATRNRTDSLELTEREVVTLASIVEKEAKVWDERRTIAAVYRNRLRIGMPLQADPTVQYARGSHESRLLYAHIEEVSDHPYNTYTHAGLPPGPIASPSQGAIEAVLDPADVDYLYFVAHPDGRHVFTHTLAEHSAAKRRMERARRERAVQGERS